MSVLQSHVSVTARMSILLETIRSVRDAVFSLTDLTFKVPSLRDLFPVGPGFRLTSPASRSMMANLRFGLDRGMGSNFLLKQIFSAERVSKESCIDGEISLFCGLISDILCGDPNGLQRQKSSSREVAETDREKTANQNNKFMMGGGDRTVQVIKRDRPETVYSIKFGAVEQQRWLQVCVVVLCRCAHSER